MSTFIKIRILHIAALIYIWIILFASIMLSYLIYSTKINEYLVIFLSIILMTIFSCLFAFIGFYLFNYILKRISYKNSTISINFKLSKPNLPSIEIDDNTRTYYRIKRHLNTITIYNTNNLDVKKFRIMSKKSRHIVRKNILIANEQYSRKRHWQLDISILAFQTLSTNSLTELISKINKYQYYEIGKFVLGYIESTSTIIIRTFDAKQISFVSLNRYQKCIKYISKYFNLPYKEIVRAL